MNNNKRENADEAAERLADSASQLEAIKWPIAIKDGNFAQRLEAIVPWRLSQTSNTEDWIDRY